MFGLVRFCIFVCHLGGLSCQSLLSHGGSETRESKARGKGLALAHPDHTLHLRSSSRSQTSIVHRWLVTGGGWWQSELTLTRAGTAAEPPVRQFDIADRIVPAAAREAAITTLPTTQPLPQARPGCGLRRGWRAGGARSPGCGPGCCGARVCRWQAGPGR
jgi:hypothetical protein